MATNSIQYRGLEEFNDRFKFEIRLIRLHPGFWHNPIQCSLEYEPLDMSREGIFNAPVYTALSYVWGNQTEAQSILVDGNPHLVTKNLFEALRRIREGSSVNRLWIDALCINQDDLKETSRQIPRMNEIYKTAQCVIIWLGENGIYDREVARTLAMDTQAVYDWSNMDSDLIIGMNSIFMRPWFERVWTLQEELCAFRDCQAILGPCQNPMTHLRKLWRLVINHNDIIPRSRMAILIQRNWIAGKLFGNAYQTKPSPRARKNAPKELELQMGALNRLGTILRSFNVPCQSTVEHDQIYGLLGLARFYILPPSLQPDMSKSFGTVYWEYTTHILKATDDIRLIERGGDSLSECGIPTWVPDFRVARDPASYVMPQGGSDTLEEVLKIPNKHLPQEPLEISNDQRVLRVLGFKLGVICNVFPQTADLGNSGENDMVRRLRTFFSQLYQFSKIDRKSPQLSFEEFVADWVYPWMGQRDGEVSQEILSKTIELLKSDDCAHEALNMIWYNFLEPMLTRDYFTTDNHISGFTTRIGAKVLEGDLVVLLEGASTFYLLRNAGENERYYFIGTTRLLEKFQASILGSTSTPEIKLNLSPIKFSLV